MEKHPAIIQELQRANGAVTKFNAGDAIAIVVDVLRLHEVKIPPTLRARLGRTAKACLADGFGPEEVVRALVTATRRGRVDLAEQILLDQQLTASGILSRSLTPTEIVAMTSDWR